MLNETETLIGDKKVWIRNIDRGLNVFTKSFGMLIPHPHSLIMYNGTKEGKTTVSLFSQSDNLVYEGILEDNGNFIITKPNQ